jgi:hypothetical protein
MKKYLLSIATVLLVVAVSCTKAQQISDLPEDINKPQDTPAGRTAEKRGVCFSTGALNWADRVVRLKANWYYNWGNDDVTAGVKGVEYVPMVWGHTMVNKGVCDRINQMYSEGKIFYVLGFNEPDLSQEANMSVTQALEDWEFLCNNLDKRIKLVSPAPSYPSRQWLVDFMNGAASRGLRVDYVAVHIYAGIGTSIYESAIRDVYNKFGKQVWITEFAPRDDNAAANGYNSYTMDPQVLNFIKTVAPKYEEMSEVFRYSWFSPGSETGMIGLQTSRLTAGDGLSLTVLGNYYNTIAPNTNAALP